MIEIIKSLKQLPVCGKYSHIAKGSNEIATDWYTAKNKIKMLWQLRKL